MPSQWVEKALFVGREAELANAKKILASASSVHTLNIHSNGDSGIGKTRFLLRVKQFCQDHPDEFTVTEELLDFYHLEIRSKIGVMRLMAENLDPQHFPGFQKLLTRYNKTVDSSERERMLPDLEKAFQDDYAAYAEAQRKAGKVVVSYFDTYEVLQIQDVENEQLRSTEFAVWLETELFPWLLEHPNTRLVVSGRHPLQTIARADYPVTEITLAGFSFDDTLEFWKKCFEVKTNAEIASQIGAASPDNLRLLHELAEGRPIFLALIVDWITYRTQAGRQEGVFARTLLANIEAETKQPLTMQVSDDQKHAFERLVIKHITALGAPESQILPYMAVAYHRMTPDMLHALLGVPQEQCQTIFSSIENLSFVKKPEGTNILLLHSQRSEGANILLLHDEMQRLIYRYFFEEAEDRDKQQRKVIASELVTYYEQTLLADENLSLAKQQVYTAEFLEYAAIADPESGLELFRYEFEFPLDLITFVTKRSPAALDRFRHEVETALEAGRDEYYELLLQQFERLFREQHPHFPESLEPDLRRLQYMIERQGKYAEALQKAEAILTEYAGQPDWETHVQRGHFLLQRGIAQFYLEQSDPAIASFYEARNVFFDGVADDMWLHETHNWIGYAYYRQGEFARAESSLTQSRKGFYHLLIADRHLHERERRQLLQGLQIALVNLAGVYNYMGRPDRAIRKVEMALHIVRRLPYNTIEIARARASAGRAFTFIGRAIDARHHLAEAERLLQNTRDPLIAGRIKTDLGFLAYRIDELENILEYYRAEDVQNMQPEHRDVIQNAKESLDGALKELGEGESFKKERADAHYALGELYMVTPSREDWNHWQASEREFGESLQWAQKSKFRYLEMDILESLITLYYFWNGDPAAAAETKKANRKKMEDRRRELTEKFDEDVYPDLWGKYFVTLGDITFDQALEQLHQKGIQDPDLVLSNLKEAFGYYVRAIHLMQRYHLDRYYFGLRVFYARVNTLVKEAQQHAEHVVQRLDDLRPLWLHSADIEEVYRDVFLQTLSSDQLKAETQRLENEIRRGLDQGNFEWALLLNDCLIEAYRKLVALYPNEISYHQRLVERLRSKSHYYRRLGYETLSGRYLQAARIELDKLKQKTFPHKAIRIAYLEGCLDCSAGTLQYRRGEYGKLLEFYLWDELKIARDKFDQIFPQGRQEALKTLSAAERKLRKVVNYWENPQQQETEENPDSDLQQHLAAAYGNLGEIQYRMNELQMLDERFDEADFQQQVFDSFQETIRHTAEWKEGYRRDDAVQSYVNALYFAQKYDHPDYCEERRRCEHQLEQKLRTAEPYQKLRTTEHYYPSVIAKLKIVQGDALFSSNFKRREYTSSDQTPEYNYILKDSECTPRELRQRLRPMLRYYVEACNLMAQHGSVDFGSAVRVLQRRIELISNQTCLEMIQDDLHHLWTAHEKLLEKSNELETLTQFASIRSILLGYEERQ